MSRRPGGKGKVLVAMSGGVDSSVAAALLAEGYEVVGVFMRLGSPGETLDSLEEFDSAQIACDPKKIRIGHQGCCSINDAADARLVAAELGVPFYVVNFKKDFGRIIDYFVDEYAAGRTPNPCVRCNDWLKFGKLHRYAEQIGADYVASGHYARVQRTPSVSEGPERHHARGGERPVADAPGSFRLLRGLDHSKDQSYVLFGVPRAQLSHMLLPIGWMEKSDVRHTAQRLGLPTFDKPDSQEICFVPDNDYAGLVERRRPGVAREGTIVDSAGAVVGKHGGQHNFTIGQRRGVGVALGHPVFVVGKDAGTNTVTIGSSEMLGVGACSVGEANWLVDLPVGAEWKPCLARYRSNGKAVDAEFRVGSNSETDSPSGRLGTFEVRFREEQRAVAPGQAIVLYDADEPDVVMGGGWITGAGAA